MSKARRLATLTLLTLSVCSLTALGFRHQTGQIDRKQMKDMLTQLGYTVKDLDTTEGKEKYSVDVTTDALNIPVAYEISPNNSYIWLTVYLGAAPTETSTTSINLLKKIADIQPSMYYVTKSGKLMMGRPIENHEVTNAVIRQATQSLVDDVGSTKEVWQAPETETTP